MSSKGDEEDLDPESLHVLQDRMMEYEESCKQCMATYNSKDIFSHYYEISERFRNMKCKYNKSPTDDLLLEAYCQNHVVKTLESIL